MAKKKASEAERLRKRIATLERKLAITPRKMDSVEASIHHAELQIEYWRLRQCLAGTMAREFPDDQRQHNIESRQCTQEAAEWERRKTEAHKATGLKVLLELERRLDEREAKENQVAEIETH